MSAKNAFTVFGNFGLCRLHVIYRHVHNDNIRRAGAYMILLRNEDVVWDFSPLG